MLYSSDLTYSKAPDANLGKRCLSVIFTHNAIHRKTRKPYKYRNSLGESAEAVLLLLSKAIVSFSHLLRQGKKKRPPYWVEAFMCWHLPIFPGRHQPSIVGTIGLNFRVRNGNGWTPYVINTNYSVCRLS